MNATLLKRLFVAIHGSHPVDVLALCDRIIGEERRLGHDRLAEDLQAIAVEARKKNLAGLVAQPPATSSSLVPLPASRRDSSPLVQVIPHEQLRHQMILSDEVEKRFLRLEKEYAGRKRLEAFGLRARNRVLLHGPPGCGKSLGVERLAWAMGLPLHKVRFDTLLSSYFGETSVNLRRIFDSANQTPCALFLDECDTIARARGNQNDVGEAQRIVNMLLQMLDDYRGDGMVIAATNLEESLDRAILRRFDEVVLIPQPGTNEIVRLLKMTFSAIRVDAGMAWEQMATRLDGMPCSDIVKCAQNAAKKAVLTSRESVTPNDLEAAFMELHMHA
jgi:SpoVK/Ycf46/Vps4 family AAA+-type ATPase